MSKKLLEIKERNIEKLKAEIDQKHHEMWLLEEKISELEEEMNKEKWATIWLEQELIHTCEAEIPF
ncbi:MAG: hypothetical protein ACRCX2_00940 [Paraclostridium sp.]